MLDRRPGRPAHPLTKGDILTLARRVFAERGYDGAGLSEVADLAGIRKPSLYHHYKSKLELYTAVLDDDVAHLANLIATAGLEAGDFRERLDHLGALVVDYLADHPATARLLMRELVGGGPFFLDGGADKVLTTLELAASFLGAGMDAGVFTKSDPKQLALSIAAIHLFPFATPLASDAFLGAPLAGAGREDRKGAVLAQVRALCLR